MLVKNSEAPPRKVSKKCSEKTLSSASSAVLDCVLSYAWFSSKDDPFLLYATLHSGNHCRFITKDLMRDHKACLPDAKTQRLFFKWQQGHQLAIINGFPGSKLTFQVMVSVLYVILTESSIQ